MLFELDTPLKTAIAIYLALALFLYYYKPNLMFKNGKIKSFGTGKGKTCLSFHIALIGIAIAAYFFVTVYN